MRSSQAADTTESFSLKVGKREAREKQEMSKREARENHDKQERNKKEARDKQERQKSKRKGSAKDKARETHSQRTFTTIGDKRRKIQ